MVLLMGVVTTLYSVLSWRDFSMKSAKTEINLTADHESTAILSELNNAMSVARSLAETLEAFKIQGKNVTRGQVIAVLHQILLENESLTGVYTAWAPDAFDGMDSAYAGEEGYDDTGRLIPYWSRDADGKISMAPLVDYEVEGNGDYYLLPKSTKTEVITEAYPYEINGKEVLMTSLAVPIIVKDKFLGIAGVDIALDYMQTRVENIDRYNGAMDVTVFTHGGMIAGSQSHPELVGEPLTSLGLDEETIAEMALSEAADTVEENGTFVTYAPITVGSTTTPWLVQITVPTAEVTREAMQAILLLVGICVVMLVIVLVGVYLQIFPVASALVVIARSSNTLAVGDLSIDTNSKVIKKIYNRRDELGVIANAFAALRDYLTQAAEDANRISNGDLTCEVKPKGDADVLGNALKQMVESLREMVSHILEDSANLSASSEQMATAANQAGLATSQIAFTIQQVASGITQQSQSAANTASSVEQMSRAIEGVALGAQEQASAVSKAASITSQISDSIGQVSQNGESVKVFALEAANLAKEGAGAVDDTLKGMEMIKNKVSVSSDRVMDMGAKSRQIGVIVETIQDIASQTNLLALNAAIEAARAGENGKGFAVVADEVRKLAERSAGATREIGELVRSIQSTVAEAVQAMNESTREVETGVGRANQSGLMLADILEAVDKVSNQAGQAAEAAAKMNEASSRLISAMDSVSAVVEQNTAATEEMAAGSNEVGNSVDNIASVSEENSAAIEEVSASTEEMSAQVEEVTASAQSLAMMAQELNAIVSRFKI